MSDRVMPWKQVGARHMNSWATVIGSEKRVFGWLRSIATWTDDVGRYHWRLTFDGGETIHEVTAGTRS